MVGERDDNEMIGNVMVLELKTIDRRWVYIQLGRSLARALSLLDLRHNQHHARTDVLPTTVQPFSLFGVVVSSSV